MQYANKKVFKKKGLQIMFNGSNCDRKSQLSGILREPLNPREVDIPDSCTFCTGMGNYSFVCFSRTFKVLDFLIEHHINTVLIEHHINTVSIISKLYFFRYFI